MIANLLPNVFAAVANDPFSARLAREHSDTNVLCMGGKIIGAGIASEIVTTWLEARFLGGRYTLRVEKLRKLTDKHCRPLNEQTRKVITVHDIRDALKRKESLLIDGNTIITPAVFDLLG
jgi:hypothetical protein